MVSRGLTSLPSPCPSFLLYPRELVSDKLEEVLPDHDDQGDQLLTALHGSHNGLSQGGEQHQLVSQCLRGDRLQDGCKQAPNPGLAIVQGHGVGGSGGQRDDVVLPTRK